MVREFDVKLARAEQEFAPYVTVEAAGKQNKQVSGNRALQQSAEYTRDFCAALCLAWERCFAVHRADSGASGSTAP